ncbi:rifin [Plasmodium sp. gorilla clade G1]|nr:rifin [Plasmodium sp. gorilla clade G1]
MKLYYTKILLFFLPLNILAHNKNKSYITIHTPITTSRVLIECNVYIPNYDNDPDMNSVRKNFHKKTEQRFHEYDKSMIRNRQKCKEKCDKEIHKIILKDKMEKSLSEKVEKGCLKCGCALGGVATSVGVLGTAVVNVWTKAATADAVNLAIQEGIKEGIKTVITQIKGVPGLNTLLNIEWSMFINESSYSTVSGLIRAIKSATPGTCTSSISPHCLIISKEETFLVPLVKDGIEATATKVASVKTIELGNVKATSTHLYSAISYSVIAIVVIVLVMVIIYLILRYRRKKKMNKKRQYTKLLN